MNSIAAIVIIAAVAAALARRRRRRGPTRGPPAQVPDWGPR
jgi:hypothetical protein